MKDNKYILFHCHHLATLYQFIWLRSCYKYDEKIVLLVNHKYFSSSLFAANLIKNQIFSRILGVQEPKNFSEKKEECFVLDYYDEYFQNNALSFSNIKEVYTACDLNNLFPVYCVLNKKAVSYIEMYEGQFSDVERYYACTEIFGYPCWWEQLQRKYSSLSGDSGNYTLKRLLWDGSKHEYPDKDIHVNFIELFYSMEAEYKNRITSCLSFLSSVDFRDMFLFLINSPRWTALMTGLSVEDYYLPYTLVIDYFFSSSKNLLIKKHPHAEDKDYLDNIFYDKNCVIPNTVPIEFMGLINDFKIKNLVSVESSGNSKIKCFVEHEIKLGREILACYQYFHRLAFIQMVINGLENIASIETIGINSTFFEVFYKFSLSLPVIIDKFPIEKKSYDIKVIADASASVSKRITRNENSHNENVLFFLDKKGLIDYIENEKKVRPTICNRIIVITIKKERQDSYMQIESNEEKVFVFCNDTVLFDEIEAIKWEYYLTYSKTKVFISGKILIVQ